MTAERKTMTAALLAAAFALQILAGCQAQAGEGGNEAPAAELVGGSGNEAPAAETGDGAVQIQLWTYPVGGFGDPEQVGELIEDFEKVYPGIRVDLKVLDYRTGDSLIEEAIEAGQMPDVVFEGPERLVADWGARGLMASLDDLWTQEDKNQIYGKVVSACALRGKTYYEFPVCMTAHTMAVNREIFEQAGALSCLDEDLHTWTTDDFVSAVSAVCDYLKGQGEADPDVGDLYCGGQGGDQGTRALVNNLYSGYFTDFSHTGYTMESPENVKALTLLTEMEGIHFAPDMAGADAIASFCEGDVPVTFCWNAGDQIKYQDSVHFTILPMMYPSEDGLPELCGGIWGFGAFDTGDEERIAASKRLIDFLTADPDEYRKSVLISDYFPVRDSMGPHDLTDLYEGNGTMSMYARFIQYVGDYYQVVPGWASARKAWWQMLQKIGSGAEVTEAVREFDRTANEAAAQALRE